MFSERMSNKYYIMTTQSRECILDVNVISGSLNNMYYVMATQSCECILDVNDWKYNEHTL